MSAQPSAGFVFPGWLESSMTNAFDRDVPSGMGAPVQRLIYGGTDAAGNLGQAAHDFGNTVQGGFLSLMTSGFDGASLRFMTLEVCHNPKGKGDCGGTPETVTQTVEMFFMPGATDPFDRLRFSKRLTLGGTEGDYLFPDANRVETDFGSFRLVEYSQTFMGEELPPGTYTMGAYGFGGGTAWRMGRQFFLSVKPAF